jgi:hypothetical protein
MSTTVNLDRAIPMNIIYPFGVDETITMTYNDVATLTSTYQIVIADNSGNIIETVAEGSKFSKATNVITWNINYETGGLLTKGLTYNFEIQDTTNDYRIFYGTLTLKNTL